MVHISRAVQFTPAVSLAPTVSNHSTPTFEPVTFFSGTRATTYYCSTTMPCALFQHAQEDSPAIAIGHLRWNSASKRPSRYRQHLRRSSFHRYNLPGIRSRSALLMRPSGSPLPQCHAERKKKDNQEPANTAVRKLLRTFPFLKRIAVAFLCPMHIRMKNRKNERMELLYWYSRSLSCAVVHKEAILVQRFLALQEPLDYGHREK